MANCKQLAHFQTKCVQLLVGSKWPIMVSFSISISSIPFHSHFTPLFYFKNSPAVTLTTTKTTTKTQSKLKLTQNNFFIIRDLCIFSSNFKSLKCCRNDKSEILQLLVVVVTYFVLMLLFLTTTFMSSVKKNDHEGNWKPLLNYLPLSVVVVVDNFA